MKKIMRRILLALAVVAMAAGAGLSQAGTAHATTFAPSENIVTTLYAGAFNPTATPASTYWSDVEADSTANGWSVGDAIVNICAPDDTGSGGCNGTDDSPQADEVNTDWYSTICSLESNGITPLYYITTDYDPGTDPWTLTDVETEMADAELWYDTDNTDCTLTKPLGFMFDETSTSTSESVYEGYYEALFDYAIDSAPNGLGAPLVMFNPGVPETTPDYMFDGTTGTQEILQQFEGDETDWQADTASGSTFLSDISWESADGYPASDFSATVYDGTTGGTSADVNGAGNIGIGNVYVTNGAEPNPYTAIPAMWSDEVLDAGDPTATTYETALDPAANDGPNDYGFNGYCMTSPGTAVSDTMELEPCADSNDQDLSMAGTLGLVSSGPYENKTDFELEWANSGLCITFYKVNGAENGSVDPILGDCAEANTQLFVLQSDSHGDFALVDPYVTNSAGKYVAVDDKGDSLTPGNTIDDSGVSTSSGDDTYASQDWAYDGN
jgi:hypothetical protein